MIAKYFPRILACLTIFMVIVLKADAQPDGAKLFTNNCFSCHNVKGDKIGPGLAGVSKTLSKEYLYKWVKNAPAVIASGDPHAVEISKKYAGEMTPFPSLTNEEIDAILAYVDAEAAKPAAGAGQAGAAGGAGVNEEKSDPVFLYIIIIVMIVLAIMLSRVIRTLDKLATEKQGEVYVEPKPVTYYLRNRKLIAAAVILGIILLGYGAVDSTRHLGRQEGYMPKQPIAFSHKIHAGINQIDCKYCHSGAEKSKTAGIPSVNVCMNCHKGITEGSTTGTTEISKIQAAFDNNQPIEWTKVHNLPDHVFFSHQQHVNVGKVECETCHGDVKEMDVVKQVKPLSMGWCVNCHRDTKVQFANNEYYKIFEKYHEDIKSGKVSSITAEQVGGTECQRCHY